MDEQEYNKKWKRFVQLVNTDTELVGEIIGQHRFTVGVMPLMEVKLYTWYAMDTERYETLVNDDRYTPIPLVVETYDTRVAAREGFEKWKHTLLTSPPPELWDINMPEFKYKFTFNANQSYN